MPAPQQKVVLLLLPLLWGGAVSAQHRTHPTGTILRKIVTGGHTYGVTIDDRDEVYVSKVMAGELLRMDFQPGSEPEVTPIGFQPPHVVVEDDGTTVFATLQGGRAVVRLDTRSGRTIDSVGLGSDGFNLALDPDGAHLVATAAGGWAYRLTRNPLALVDSVFVGRSPNGVVFDPRAHRVYVSPRDHSKEPALLGALAAAPLVAQNPHQPPKQEFSSDLSFVNATGNTRTTTTGFSERYIVRPGWRWTHTQTFGVIYGKNAGTVNTENYRAGLKTDLAFTPRFGSYGSWNFVRNRFAGIEAQYVYSLGLSAQLLYATNDQITIEAGLARIAQLNTGNGRDDFFSARTAASYHHSFGTATYFEQTIEFLPNLKDARDLRVNSTSALVAPIATHFGLRAGYAVRYDHEPRPGFRSTDAVFTTGLQINF